MTETTGRTTYPHEWYRDLLGAYALDALLPDEAAEMEAHLATCPTCPEELRLLRLGVQTLALTAEERDPSPQLRDRLQTAISASPREIVPPPFADSTPEPQTTMRPPAPISLDQARAAPAPNLGQIWTKIAAALVVILIGSLIAWNFSLRDDGGTEGRVVGQFATTADAPSADSGGEIRYLEDDNVLLLEMNDLPELAEGEVYQLWLVQGDVVSPSVTFEPSPTAGENTLVAVVSNPDQLDALAITREPGPLGSVSATTPIIMIAEV